MFARPITLFSRLALLSAAATLAACATQQENPHYQHSTKYHGDSPVTAMASNTAYGSSSSANSSYAGTTSSAGSAYQQASHTTSYQQANHQQADGSYLVQSSHPVYASNAAQRQGRNLVVVAQPNHSQPEFIQAAHTQPAYSQSTSYPQSGYGQSSAASYSQISAECVSSGAQGQAHCIPASMPLTAQTASVATPYYSEPQTLYVTSETTTAISPTHSTKPDSYGTPGYEAMKNAESGWSTQNTATPEWETAQAKPQHAAAAYTGTHAVLNVPQAVPMTEPFASPLPAPASRGALVQPARSQDIMAAPQHSQTLGMQYEVQEGDTVYSFSRKLCSSVEDIRSMNGLDGSYGIQLGQMIRLPASQC